MRADARLALPVLGAWAVIIAILGPNQGAAADTLTTIAGGIALLSALVAVAATIAATISATVAARLAASRGAPATAGVAPACHWITPLLAGLGLSSFFTFALTLSIYGHAPTHVDIPPWESDPTSVYPWFLLWAQDLRDSLSTAASSLPGVGGQLIPGLAIGDTTAVSEVLETAMKTVSLTHITAVSGANCVIVTASIMLLGAKLGLSRSWRVTWAVIALLLFVVLVTPESSVVRAAVMSTVVLVTMALGRPGSGLPLLAFAVVVMLIVDPWWSIDFGFILSVCATAGLLVLARPLARSLARFLPQLPAMLISIPLAAQLVCQPVIILLQPQIPTYGVWANVIAGPAAPLATVTGLIACLVLMVLPPVGHLLLWISWVPAQWIGQTAMVFSTLPTPSIAWLAGIPGVVLTSLISIACLLALLHPRKPVRRVMGLGLGLSCIVYAGSVIVGGLIFTARMPPDWIIAACDVGQGDAVLFRDGDHIALIDTGRKPQLLQTCLQQLGITRIDLLILTHYDLDHAGGVSAVNGKVERALVGTPQDSSESAVVESLVEGGAIVERGDKGDSGSLGNATWQVLWPAPGYSSMQEGNPGSITVRFQTPVVSAIFLGDLGEQAQNALMADSSIETVDVVKVAHHGSSDQSAALYRRLQARLGIVSVGADNGYGHPTQKALEMIKAAGTSIARTDQGGLILVSIVADRLSLWSER